MQFKPFGWRVLGALHFDMLNWSRRPIHVSSLSVRIILPTTESLEKGMEMCAERKSTFVKTPPYVFGSVQRTVSQNNLMFFLKSAARRWATGCNYRNRSSVFSAVKGLWTGRSGIRFPAEVQEIYLFSETSWLLWFQPVLCLTLIILMWRIGWAHNNARK